MGLHLVYHFLFTHVWAFFSPGFATTLVIISRLRRVYPLTIAEILFLFLASIVKWRLFRAGIVLCAVGLPCQFV